nr:EOG090X0B12 [Lepidurus arcticus]
MRRLDLRVIGARASRRPADGRPWGLTDPNRRGTSEILSNIPQEQENKLLQFQEMTGIEDEELSRSILVQHGWNMEAAIHDHLGLEDDRIERAVPSPSAPVLQELRGPGILGFFFTLLSPLIEHDSWRTESRGIGGWAFQMVTLPIRLWYDQIHAVVTLIVIMISYEFNVVFLAITDPLGDVVSFISQYDATYGANHPTFYQGTYSQALSDAKKELKFLLVYLHSADHQDTGRFCRMTLTSPSVISYINENMLFWGCSVTLPEGYRVSQALRENTYPFLALVVLRLNKMTVVGRLEGYLGPEVLVQQLQALVSDNEAFLIAARADRYNGSILLDFCYGIFYRNERNFNQSLRLEQDEAYLQSLMADREKEAKKRQEREEKEKEELQKLQEILQEEHRKEVLIQRKRDAIDLVPSEPASENPDALKLLVRLPSGQRLERRFLRTHGLADIYHYVLSHPDSPFHFEVATGFPRRNLPCLPVEGKQLPTLSESGIGNAEVLYVSDLDAYLHKKFEPLYVRSFVFILRLFKGGLVDGHAHVQTENTTDELINLEKSGLDTLSKSAKRRQRKKCTKQQKADRLTPKSAQSSESSSVAEKSVNKVPPPPTKPPPADETTLRTTNSLEDSLQRLQQTLAKAFELASGALINTTVTSPTMSSASGIQVPVGSEPPVKSREEILAERKAKKAEKGNKGQVAQDGNVTHASKPTATNPEEEGKSKAELRAERRAKQEAQRAAKTTAQAPPSSKQGSVEKSKVSSAEAQEKPSKTNASHTKEKTKAVSSAAPTTSSKQAIRVSDVIQADSANVEKKLDRKLASQQVPKRTEVKRKVQLFSHLKQYSRDDTLTHALPVAHGSLHPAVVRLGLQYAQGQIIGSNARSLALLLALKQLIADYVTPEDKELCRDLEAKLKPHISFLSQCRPLSVSMGNAIRHLKLQISHTDSALSDDKAKEKLHSFIDEYIQAQIIVAGKAISQFAREKIADGDVILTYGCSSVLKQIFCDAFDAGKKFRVIVLDGRPKLEGRSLLRHLVTKGISADYAFISAASYMIPEVTKVFLGAHALLANGHVMSRVGSSQVALIAKAHNVPVLVCCETHKFSERVQTDSFVFNELCDPEEFATCPGPKDSTRDSIHQNWKEYPSLSLLNLAYDVTPPDLVTAVITELGVLPCTSVPVVLRVKQVEPGH